MTGLLERLLDEHANLVRLVRLLDTCPIARALEGDKVAIKGAELLVDALYYLTRFPDQLHHPAEDGIVARLQQKSAIDDELAETIRSQHATLARHGEDLMRDLESAAREETMSWALVHSNVRLYAELLRHNMATEELALFPLAQRHLEADDWSALEQAEAANAPRDPLFGKPVDARFAQLRRIIARESDCGCEVHPR